MPLLLPIIAAAGSVTIPEVIAMSVVPFRTFVVLILLLLMFKPQLIWALLPPRKWKMMKLKS